MTKKTPPTACPANSVPAATNDFSSLQVSATKAKEALDRLDTEYAALHSTEDALLEALYRAQEDERTLRAALDQASGTLQEQRARELRKQQEEAASRLESALLGGDSDDEEDDSENDAPAEPVGGTRPLGLPKTNEEEKTEEDAAPPDASIAPPRSARHGSSDNHVQEDALSSSSSSGGDIDEDELLNMVGV